MTESENFDFSSLYNEEFLREIVFICAKCYEQGDFSRLHVTYLKCPFCDELFCPQCSDEVLKDAKRLSRFAETWPQSLLAACPRCFGCVRLITFINEQYWIPCKQAKAELDYRAMNDIWHTWDNEHR